MPRGSEYLLYWLIGLLGIMVINGCGETDNTPAQYLWAVNDEEFWEVYFDIPPENLNVTGAKEYTLLGTKLRITGTKCGTDTVVSWQGGQETFHYTCDDPPLATKILEIEPQPGAIIPPNQRFRLTLDAGVVAVMVNGTAAVGSGNSWTAMPPLPEGNTELYIEWRNQDSTPGSQVVGPYTVRAE